MVTFHKERRHQERKLLNLPLTYVYPGEGNVAPHVGETFDLCNSGMSFYTDIPLKKGLVIQVQTPIWNCPRAGTIRWRSKKSHSVYKVGVSF